MERMMKSFQERINELRWELIQSIIEILESNGLQRLDLSENLENPTCVIWHNPQEEVFYNSSISSVAVHENEISIDVEDCDTGCKDTLYSEQGDYACLNPDWLIGLRENILETIHEKNIQNNQAAIELAVLDNGNLEIAIVDREEFEVIIAREFDDERACLYDLMDNSRYIGNDWHCLYEIGLTEAPAIGQGAVYPENENENDGLPVNYENFWYFPDYMILSYLEVLEKEGKVVFTGHSDNICKKKKTA
jgi:hypothetical protein